ncbi:hypothetical protein BBJ28_00005130 [Nothophytophthora sp. Chile5]|nr:hypothetical protein BBJ28_00005130 [Nothophytophthora sp. Chile5]
MKLTRGVNVEHIKRMTQRTLRESNEGQAEFLSFMTALERNDFDENLCKREARHMTLVLEAKVTTTSPRNDIEVAYGGLPSPQSDAASLLRLRDEMEKELVNDKTPTLFDDFDPARAYGDWDDELEKKLLESGAPPSPWWSPSPPHSEKGVDKADAKEEVDLGEENIPLPDDLPDDALDDLDDNDLLDELVCVDVDAAFKEK